LNARYRNFLITASIVLGLGGFIAITNSFVVILGTDIVGHGSAPDLNGQLLALSIVGTALASIGFDRARKCRGSEAAGWLVAALVALLVWIVLLDAAVHGWDDLRVIPGAARLPDSNQGLVSNRSGHLS